jgi:hypothetical protein
MCVVAWLSPTHAMLDVSGRTQPVVHEPPADEHDCAVQPSAEHVPHVSSVVIVASVVHVPAWVGP